VADGFFFATDFLPFLIGMGKQPQNMMDHVRPPVVIAAVPQ
jgi:hypothetical protein